MGMPGGRISEEKCIHFFPGFDPNFTQEYGINIFPTDFIFSTDREIQQRNTSRNERQSAARHIHLEWLYAHNCGNDLKNEKAMNG
jgi:hypothetical protein